MGALKAITSILDPIDYSYDVVVGVSVGAINAAFFSLYEIGDEKDAVAKLQEMW